MKLNNNAKEKKCFLMNYGRSILVSKKDVAIFNFMITLKLILPYRNKLGKPQNIRGLNLTNKFVLFYCLFFCRNVC